MTNKLPVPRIEQPNEDDVVIIVYMGNGRIIGEELDIDTLDTEKGMFLARQFNLPIFYQGKEAK